MFPQIGASIEVVKEHNYTTYGGREISVAVGSKGVISGSICDSFEIKLENGITVYLPVQGDFFTFENPKIRPIRERFAEALSSHGYGCGEEVLLKMLQKLTDSEIDDLAYACYRTSEKSGHDAFWMED